ncbi:hypothetical protein JW964_26830 [candidate division KSB1 bacterium]|nr:hypothetical protein [candidate division KSB1 bacterium]
MKSILFTLLFVLFFIPANAQDSPELVGHPIRFVAVPLISHSPVLDGNLNDICWQSSAQLTDFVLTAGDPGKPANYQTTAWLGHDATHLYVAFRCPEPEISRLKMTSKMWDDLDILFDDRVEIFLDINHDHRNYIELAVNPNGVQFDQTGFNRLNGSKTCDMNPAWNCRWQAKTSIGQNEWIAEIAIDVTSLGIKNLENGITWGLNLARVRFPDVVKGDEFFNRKPQGDAEYSAWAPVNDYIRETISNFHAPVEFGDMVFGDPGFKVEKFTFRTALYAFGPVGFPSLFGKNPLLIHAKAKNNQSLPLLLKLTVEPTSVNKWEFEQLIQLESGKVIETFYHILEAQENKIVIQLLDPKTKKQLYRTSYIELAPPFIEFDLEPLYTRAPQKVQPVKFRLLTDPETLSQTALELKFCNLKTDKIIAAEKRNDLTAAGNFLPVFDINALRLLAGDNYYIDCKLFKKDNALLAHFKQNLTKFDPELPAKFFAEEGDFSYGGITNHAIRIRYPFPAEFTFWRSGSYIPWWDVDQAAMTNEFIECWGGGNQGCCEPMQDRECRYSQVELLENSPVRAVVHWRYALSDPHYKIYRNEWVDEYYTLYPDGAGIRQVNLWPNSNTRHEMFEVLLAKPPGVQTEQLFEEKFATLSNLNGEGYSNKKFYESKKFYTEFLEKANDFVIEIHFKERMHPFTVFSLRDELMPGVTRDHVTACSRIVGTADRRGHWPASRYQIDGYNTVGLHVPHHGNIGNIQAEIDPKNQPTTWTFMIGVAPANSKIPEQQAKSWLYPAEIKALDKKSVIKRYDFLQRAYRLVAPPNTKTIKIQMQPKENNIFHPVFIIENLIQPIKNVMLNGKKLDQNLYSVGESRNKEVIVFLNIEINDKQTLTFETK